MHEEILTREQIKLLPLVKAFRKRFGLVGGTAIALQIGHRRSIDFDLFSDTKFSNASVRRNIAKWGRIDYVYRDEDGQCTLTVHGVRFTFFRYPYHLEYKKEFQTVRMPDLLTLAAMKIYALGRRAKWKDYIDLYFILEKYHGIDKIIQRAKKIFKQEFNEKIVRAQLSYFDDIDYSEKVIYMPGFKVPDATVKKALVEFSIS